MLPVKHRGMQPRSIFCDVLYNLLEISLDTALVCLFFWFLAIGTTAHLVVELAVDWCPITIDQLEGVRAIAIHVPVAIWDATVTEQEGHLVGGLWAETDEVPEHVRILCGFYFYFIKK